MSKSLKVVEAKNIQESFIIKIFVLVVFLVFLYQEILVFTLRCTEAATGAIL